MDYIPDYSLVFIFFVLPIIFVIQPLFLNKINDTKIFNLDDESLLMEFEDRVLNG